jgi:carbohydrate-selective porin OprB
MMRVTSLGFLAAVLVSGSAYAADDSFQPGITGDWNGTRTQLQNAKCARKAVVYDGLLG